MPEFLFHIYSIELKLDEKKIFKHKKPRKNIFYATQHKWLIWSLITTKVTYNHKKIV